jgi:hypothetical protein
MGSPANHHASEKPSLPDVSLLEYSMIFQTVSNKGPSNFCIGNGKWRDNRLYLNKILKVRPTSYDTYIIEKF